MWTLRDEKTIEDSELKGWRSLKRVLLKWNWGEIYCLPSLRGRDLQPSLALIPLRFVSLNSVDCSHNLPSQRNPALFFPFV